MIKKKISSFQNKDGLPYKVVQAVNYIEKNYSRLLSNELISTHLRLDKRHLSRLFKKKIGVTPMEYLDNHRLMLAKKLLSDENVRILKVAEKVGIPHLDFNNWFRKNTEMTPEDYRDSYENVKKKKERESENIRQPASPSGGDFTD
jgi:transcriptional regulator GlxA family with amidase domain